MSWMNIENKTGWRILPYGTPDSFVTDNENYEKLHKYFYWVGKPCH